MDTETKAATTDLGHGWLAIQLTANGTTTMVLSHPESEQSIYLPAASYETLKEICKQA